jgi:hypothetical protein
MVKAAARVGGMLLAVGVAVAVAGCSSVIDKLTSSGATNEFSGDPFPTGIDDSSGAVLVGVQEAGSNAQRIAVLDVLSPLTLIDRGLGVPISIEETDLTVLGARTPGGELDLPRARFTSQQVVTLHPCRTAECAVGTGSNPRPFNALIGLDAFTGDALRLRLADDEIFILPDIAGSDERRGRVCDAVLDSPFRGGGTLVIGGTEVPFTNLRTAIDACIAPEPSQTATQAARGLDVLMVASTAIGTSLLSRTAYGRLRELYTVRGITLPTIDMLPEQTVLLPSGPTVGNLTRIPSIALVGNSGSNPRAPCRQMWASHLLGTHDCEPGDDCPCTGSDTICGVPSVTEIQPDLGISILVVPDTEATLQSLRTELRPDRPEVDGILGTEALELLELDVDYTHDRLLARCTDRQRCGARIALSDDTTKFRDSRRFLNGCLADMPGPIVLQP